MMGATFLSCSCRLRIVYILRELTRGSSHEYKEVPVPLRDGTCSNHLPQCGELIDQARPVALSRASDAQSLGHFARMETRTEAVATIGDHGNASLTNRSSPHPRRICEIFIVQYNAIINTKLEKASCYLCCQSMLQVYNTLHNNDHLQAGAIQLCN